MFPDITLFIQSLEKACIPASLNRNMDCNKEIPCYYRNNPDGTIRWIWPKHSRKAEYLRFYHISGTKPRLFALIIHLLSKLGLSFLISNGRFSWYTTDDYYNDKLTGNSWAWFSGTIGPDRKAILWKKNPQTGNSVFIKIALTDRAVINLRKESIQINKYKPLVSEKVKIPEAIFTGVTCKQEDVGANTQRTNCIWSLPQQPLLEWMKTNYGIVKGEHAPFLQQIKRRISDIMQQSDPRFDHTFLNNLSLLADSIQDHQRIPLTTAHGDFTPWNVMYNQDQLILVDWELSRDQMPYLFDFFHFIYQSGILIGNKGYAAIRKEIDVVFNQPQWQQLLNNDSNNLYLLEKCYLLETITYYLQVYHLQPQWHKQVSWLLKTWNNALLWHIARENIRSPRKLMLAALNQVLNDKQYALLKWKYKTLASLPEHSDVDICISKAALPGIIQELKSNILVSRMHVNRKTFMQQVELILLDGSLLHIDLLHDFRRKSQTFLSAETLLSRIVKNEYGLNVPAPDDNFKYTWLFYWLNRSDIPQEYLDLFEQHGTTLTNMLQQQYQLPVSNFTEVGKFNQAWYKQVKNTLYKEFNHAIGTKISNLAAYCTDTFLGIFHRRGFVVTFSGVDGAGKSTIIERTRFLIEKCMRRKVIVIRHRPSVLPIISSLRYGKSGAELRAASTLPRKGNNRLWISSFFRFCWYLADYLIGQWIVQFRYVNKGYIVLYDRYYFDFINDARRSNIQLPSSFIRWFYHLMLKPQLNFFLYATPELILSRKQELDYDTISHLTSDYLSLFKKLSAKNSNSQYIPIENNQLNETLNIVLNHIKHISHEKAD